MSRKLICIFVSIFFISILVGDIKTTEGKFDDRRTVDAVQQVYAKGDSIFSGKEDLIVDILQNITEPLYLTYLENITAFGTRRTGTTSCYNAGTYLYNEFQNMGLTVRYQEWNNGGYQDRNIEATLPGVNQTSDQLYLIFGHYDTVSNCPGADDDASGVSTVLMAAYLLRQYSFEYTIRFVAFSGEEQWMLGSHEYVEEAVQNGDNIVAVLNVDMIGYALTPTHASNIKIYDNGNPRWVTNFTVNMSLMYYDDIQLTALPSGFADSDQTYFWESGFEGIFYHEYKFNDYYHTSQDTIAHMDISYAVKCSRLAIATLATLADIQGSVNTAPETPIMTGPTTGFLGLPYSFNATTTDPDGDTISFMFDWGDGENSGWLEPIASGATQTGSHIWVSTGTFDITVKAKDSNGAESGVSDAHTIIIATMPVVEIGDITGGLFKLNAVIKNTGGAAATNVEWSIKLTGGLIILGKESTGTIPTIAAGASADISSKLILGFGKTVLTVTADTATKSQNATVLLVFIKI